MTPLQLFAITRSEAAPTSLPRGKIVHAAGLAALLLPPPRLLAAGTALLRAVGPARRALGRDLVARQRLLEALHRAGPVLPAEAAPIALDEAAHFLIARASPVKSALNRLEGVAQYELTLDWDPAGVLAQFRNSAELAPVFAGSPVAASRVAEAVATLRRRLADGAASQLSRVAEDLLPLPTEADDSAVARFAILIRAEEAAALDPVLEAIDAIWPEGFRLRLTGPTPATAFSALRLVRPPDGALSAAARLLEVPEDGLTWWSNEELRTACRAGLREGRGEPDALRAAERLLAESAAAARSLRAAGLSDAPLPPCMALARSDGAPPVLPTATERSAA